MSFDPTNFNPSEHGSGGGELLPASTFIFWVRSFKRKMSKGKDQILFICDPILDSDHNRISKDRYAPIFETITLTADAAWRLADLSEAVGRKTPYNAMSDREIAAIFRFKPFKAKVKHETYQGNTSAKFSGYLTMNGDDEKAVDGVLEDNAVNNATGAGYDEHDPGGSYDGGGGNHVDSQSFDDDIPF